MERHEFPPEAEVYHLGDGSVVVEVEEESEEPEPAE